MINRSWVQIRASALSKATLGKLFRHMCLCDRAIIHLVPFTPYRPTVSRGERAFWSSNTEIQAGVEKSGPCGDSGRPILRQGCMMAKSQLPSPASAEILLEQSAARKNERVRQTRVRPLPVKALNCKKRKGQSTSSQIRPRISVGL